jgi:dipeptidase E
MNLHLFSSPGKDDIRYILEAARPYLEPWEDPQVAYLPAASLSDEWQGYTEKAFRGLARVETINTELQAQAEMEAILRRAALVYIPGGNTFLLDHRLHLCKLFDFLGKKITSGLPLIAFSAGTILCGPNILTSKDMNMVGGSYFNGLNLVPFNFSVHYPEAELSRVEKDEWLRDYHVFHDNPLILMSDGAYICVQGKKTRLVRGEAWIWRKGEEKQKLEPGELIHSNAVG